MQEVVILVLCASEPCKKLTFRCGDINLFGWRNKLLFMYFKRKEAEFKKKKKLLWSCQREVMICLKMSRHVLQSIYCEKKGEICPFYIINIWVETSAPILQYLCSWAPFYLSFIKSYSTHYIASSSCREGEAIYYYTLHC